VCAAKRGCDLTLRGRTEGVVSASDRIPYHPAANLFPMMSEEELDTLAKDIKAHGQHHPILLYDGQILDGRNRYEACAIAGVEPKTLQWDGSGGSPTEFVLSLNAHRRHLTASQKAMVAVNALPLLQAEARERKREKAKVAADTKPRDDQGRLAPVEHKNVLNRPTVAPHADVPPPPPAPPPRKAAEVAAQIIGVSQSYVEQAKQIKAADPVLAQEVCEGKKKITEAKKELEAKKAGKPAKAPDPPLAAGASALARVRATFAKFEADAALPDEQRKVAAHVAQALDQLREEVTGALARRASVEVGAA
jgi:hypothetical protein